MSDNKTVQRFFAYVLMAIGGLIALLCGGCTVVFLGALINSALINVGGRGPVTPAWRYNAFWGVIRFSIVPLVVGGLPTAVGVVMFVLGRRMAKDER
jgi:hypothetical protein